jgi:8-oxo-dGTP diphosphatase
VSFPPGILARGPWHTGQVAAHWREDRFEPAPQQTAAADRAIAELEDRGSPAHDGLAARLAGFEAGEDGLRLELQPMRWSLRLVAEDASGSLAVLCVTRDAEGRWLAGRRAPWVASWAGRWALGAGGAVEVGEDPIETLTRELQEEWSVTPERLAVEALVSLPNRLAMLVGQAWLPAGAEVRRDHEHDAHDWWPRDVAEWPEEAHPSLRHMATLLDA